MSEPVLTRETIEADAKAAAKRYHETKLMSSPPWAAHTDVALAWMQCFQRELQALGTADAEIPA